MKKLFLITTLLVFTLGVRAQQQNTVNPDSTVFQRVDTEPIFPGGQTKLYEFITQNVKATGDKGLVFISFIVEKDGSISNVQAIRGASESAKKEAVRVMNLSPKWTAGMQNGQPVRVSYTLPIKFN